MNLAQGLGLGRQLRPVSASSELWSRVKGRARPVEGFSPPLEELLTVREDWATVTGFPFNSV